MIVTFVGPSNPHNPSYIWYGLRLGPLGKVAGIAVEGWDLAVQPQHGCFVVA